MYCTYCGAKMTYGQKYCGNCGRPAENTADRAEDVTVSEPIDDFEEEFLQSTKRKAAGLLKKWMHAKYIIPAVLIVLLAAALILFGQMKKQEKYELAAEALSSERYEEAAGLYEDLGHFRDSKKLYQYSANCMLYYEAEDRLTREQFSLALENYELLGSFADAADKAAFCRKKLDYLRAEELTESGMYSEALELYTALEHFEDSREMASFCTDAICFESAVSLFRDGEYQKAKEMFSGVDHEFEQLGEYLEACDTAAELRIKLLDMEQGNYHKYTSLPKINTELLSSDQELLEQYLLWSKYYEALTNLNSGACYQAMLLFDELGDVADARALSAACPQEDPKTGELYHNKSFSGRGVSLRVVMPADGTKNVIKLYTKSGTLVSVAFAAPGDSINIHVPGGTYMVKNGYSTGAWYGSKDLFGPNGTYQIMTFDDSEYFELKAGYSYTMTLRAISTVVGDPVGEKPDEWGHF